MRLRGVNALIMFLCTSKQLHRETTKVVYRTESCEHTCEQGHATNCFGGSGGLSGEQGAGSVNEGWTSQHRYFALF